MGSDIFSRAHLCESLNPPPEPPNPGPHSALSVTVPPPNPQLRPLTPNPQFHPSTQTPNPTSISNQLPKQASFNLAGFYVLCYVRFGLRRKLGLVFVDSMNRKYSTSFSRATTATTAVTTAEEGDAKADPRARKDDGGSEEGKANGAEVSLTPTEAFTAKAGQVAPAE